MRRALTGVAAFVLGLGAAGSAVFAQSAATEEFKYPDGPLDKKGTVEVDGWAGTWKAPDFNVSSNSATGAGAAERRMIPTVNFAVDDEWLFTFTLQRSGCHAASRTTLRSTSATLTAPPEIAAVPMHVGISSRDVYELGIGVKDQKFFGKADTNDPRTFLVQLTTKKDGPDKLRVWVFKENKLPAALPAKADGESEVDYGGKSNLFKIASAKTEGFSVSICGVKIANDFAAIAAAPAAGATTKTGVSPQGSAFPHPYRALPRLRVTPTGRRPLSTHWSSISILPWSAEGPPAVIESATQRWYEQRQTIYQPQPATSPGVLPVYRAAPFSALPHGQFSAVPTGKPGEFVLLERAGLTYHAFRSRGVDGTPMFAEPVPLQTTGDVGGQRFFADVDGDGALDLLLGRLVNPAAKWTNWPQGKSPWLIPRQPDTGPHRDLDVVPDGFRGYDLAGNWLGDAPTYAVFWCKGSRAGATLAFDAAQPIYYGRDDFPLQWKHYGMRTDPAMVERGGKRYLVLFGAVDQVMAMPIEGVVEGRLTVGRAASLMRAGEDMRLSALPDVHAVIDLDGDGQTELVTGSGNTGRVSVIGGDRVGDFVNRGNLTEIGGYVSVDTLAVPEVADWNADGRPDLICGDSNGLISLWPGTAAPLVFAGALHFTDVNGQTLFLRGERNLQGPQEKAWGYSQVEAGDWDGDGKLDRITNDNTATMNLLRRSSESDPLRLRCDTFTDAAGGKLAVAWRARPAIVPGAFGVVGDKRAGLLYLDIDQRAVIGFPEKAGGTVIGRKLPLQYDDGNPIVLAGFGGASGRTDFQIVDWDGDTKWDIVFSGQPVNFPVS